MDHSNSHLDENLIVLCTTNDEVQEAIFTSTLDEAGVDYIVRSFHDSALDGLFESTNGHSCIFVFEDDFPKAQSLIQSLENEIP